MGNHQTGKYSFQQDSPSERHALRTVQDKLSGPFVIKDPRCLTLCTRIVFVLTLLVGVGVMAASICLMLECRRSFSLIRALVSSNSKFCTNLGMQALFACCVILFTVFGLGCIGRRMTGYAILIISSVAFFQGVMTLVFYQCRTMGESEVIHAVNVSIETCHFGNGPPFSLGLQNPAMTQSARYSNGRDVEFSMQTVKQHMKRLSFGKDTRKWVAPVEWGQGHGSVRLSDVLTAIDQQQKDPSSHRHDEEQILCHETSAYFVVLGLQQPKDTVSECVKVCENYKSLCVAPGMDVRHTKATTVPSSSSSSSSSSSFPSSSTSSYPSQERELLKSRHKTYSDIVSDCGRKVLLNVQQFCFYDNSILMPLSICSPVFFMMMAACFLYLAYCDRLNEGMTCPTTSWSALRNPYGNSNKPAKAKKQSFDLTRLSYWWPFSWNFENATDKQPIARAQSAGKESLQLCSLVPVGVSKKNYDTVSSDDVEAASQEVSSQ